MRAVMSERLKCILNDKCTRKELQELLNNYHRFGHAAGLVGGILYTIKGNLK